MKQLYAMAKVYNIRSALLVKSVFAALYVLGVLITSTEACVSTLAFQRSSLDVREIQ
jgi:hypothetical protein